MLRVEAEQHWMCLETGLWEGGANEDLIRGSMRKPDGEVGAVVTHSFPECGFEDLK